VPGEKCGTDKSTIMSAAMNLDAKFEYETDGGVTIDRKSVV